MGDLIDRQDVIDAVAFGITYVKVFDQETGEIFEPFKQENEALNKAVDRIKNLPSVDAVEARRGRWRYDDISELKYCSECYFGKDRMDKRMYNFCPNCGAMMEVDDERFN